MSGRPWIEEGGELGQVMFEARAFGSTLECFNCLGGKWSTSDHTSLFLVRPDEPGRMPVLASLTKGSGAFFDVDWQRVFRLAYARSKQPFEERGSGEQIFAAPSVNSRMVLVDDLKTPVPLFPRTLCAILETSQGNFQHLYCADKVLTQDERKRIQTCLAVEFGGDAGATGGAQPHRVPGSVNYKPGRGLWVCRLIGNVTESLNGGRPLPSARWLAKQLGQSVKPEVRGEAAGSAPASRRSGGVSASELDWAWCIRRASEMRACGMSREALRDQLECALAERSRERRGRDAERYSRLTVFNLGRRGHL